ncbi:MAG: hypothetical protein ACI9L9_001178 [Marivirga sp.]
MQHQERNTILKLQLIMKKFAKYAMFFSAVSLGFMACDDSVTGEDPMPVPEEGGIEVTITSNVTTDTNWSADSIYILGGRVAVESGATLTIEPGTIVKGKAGTGSNATALIVARGAKIIAEGTADAPIIFTSVADDITLGQTISPNLDETIDALWGGIIVLGSAPISAQNENDQDVSELQIEGIPTSDPNGLYGGSASEDNSGVLKYISIRHGGANIGQGNEINGLTLGGVGSGTVIEYIEVVANQDDGIEWFGGTVSVKNVLVWNAGDDGLDTDQAWNGTCDGFIIVTPVNGSAFELDGPEGAVEQGFHTFTNGIVFAGELGEELVDLDGSTNANITNVYFFGITTPIVVESYADVAAAGGVFSGWEYTLGTDDDGNAIAYADVFIDVPQTVATAVALNANTVGPTTSAFAWTWAAQSGALASIGL